MKQKVVFISSVGGHLTQLLQLKSLFKKYDYVLITEKTALTKQLNFKKDFLLYGSKKGLYKIVFPFVVAINCIKSVYLFIKYNPGVIVTTGTHVIVPYCYIGKMFRRKIIFIESYASINKPTLSGRMVYPIASRFIVQWEELLKIYPKAKYYGGIY